MARIQKRKKQGSDAKNETMLRAQENKRKGSAGGMSEGHPNILKPRAPRKTQAKQPPTLRHKDKNRAGSAAQMKRSESQNKTRKGQKVRPITQKYSPSPGSPPREHVEMDPQCGNLDFDRFRTVQKEGYSYLSNHVATTYGLGLGPEREGFTRGCLSKGSYEVTAPYPQPIWTTMYEDRGMKEKWSREHARRLAEIPLQLPRTPAASGVINGTLR